MPYTNCKCAINEVCTLYFLSACSIVDLHFPFNFYSKTHTDEMYDESNPFKEMRNGILISLKISTSFHKNHSFLSVPLKISPFKTTENIHRHQEK